MKRSILIATMITFATLNSFAQIKIAPEAGVNLATAKYKEPSYGGLGGSTYSYSTSFIVGGKAGVIVDIPVAGFLSIQPGMFYSMKGYDITYTDLGESFDGRMRANYIEMPANVLYKTGAEGTGRFFVGAGPYFAVALHGKISVSGSSLGLPSYDYEESLSIGNGIYDMIKRIDFGANACAGYELPMGLFFRGQFSYGIYNTSPMSVITQKNWGGTVSVGFLF